MKRVLTVVMLVIVAVCAACAQTTTIAPDGGGHAFAQVHTDLAAQYYQVGQVSVAVQEAEQALSGTPNFVPAHNLLALMYAQLHENTKANEHFTKALSIEPKNTDLRNNYAWFLCGTNRSTEALTEFSKVLRDPLYPSMDKALTNAGACAARIGRLDLATSYLNAALKVNPNNGVAYLYRGHVALNEQSYAAASEALQAAENTLGRSTSLLWLSARLAKAQGRTEQLNQIIAAIVQESPISEEAAWARAGQFDVF